MTWKNDLEIFLGGTFHQDIESPQKAVSEYAKEYKESLNEIIKVIDKFFECNMNHEEMNEFLIQNTEIYFSGLGKEPIRWLEGVNNFFKDELKKQ
jgi:phage/plasmid-associated DNA primase